MEQTSTPVKEFIDPEAIIGQLDISKDSQVADFGCGAGYFSIPIARKIPDGKLHAFDVLKAALESVESKAKMDGLTNIVTGRVNLEKEGGSKLLPDSLDWVILKDMLFQNKNKSVILKEARRVLKPGGKVLVVEWDEQNGAMGPQSDMKISLENLEKMVLEENYKIEKKVEAGDFHYGFVAVK